ncbi:MAG: hypothetical protein K2Q22_14700, partial [Cytophagales bacterium]|nr:hypothetical protein [Cytophagales bacterium]
MKRISLFHFLLFLGSIGWPAWGQKDSIQLKSYPRMGFSDLNWGGYISSYSVNSNRAYSDSSQMPYTEKYALGVSVRFQASFLDFYLKQQHRKFEIVDILGAEFMVGGEYAASPMKEAKPW